MVYRHDIDFRDSCPCAALAQIREEVMETRYAAMVARAFAEQVRRDTGVARSSNQQLVQANAELCATIKESVAAIREQMRQTEK